VVQDEQPALLQAATFRRQGRPELKLAGQDVPPVVASTVFRILKY